MNYLQLESLITQHRSINRAQRFAFKARFIRRILVESNYNKLNATSHYFQFDVTATSFYTSTLCRV